MAQGRTHHSLPKSVIEPLEDGSQRELVCHLFKEDFLCIDTVISPESQAEKEALFDFFDNGGTPEQAKNQFANYVDPTRWIHVNDWNQVMQFFGDSDLVQRLYAKFGRATRPY